MPEERDGWIVYADGSNEEPLGTGWSMTEAVEQARARGHEHGRVVPADGAAVAEARKRLEHGDRRRRAAAEPGNGT